MLTDMTMVKFWDCFHDIIIFVMLYNEIGWHDLQIRQVSGNLQIVQCKLARLAGWQIDLAGRLADWPGRQIGRNIRTCM